MAKTTSSLFKLEGGYNFKNENKDPFLTEGIKRRIHRQQSVIT